MHFVIENVKLGHIISPVHKGGLNKARGASIVGHKMILTFILHSLRKLS